MTLKSSSIGVMLLLSFLLSSQNARAHCDTLNGPVVSAARAALRASDVTPVLKWVRPSDEAEVKDAFRKTMAIRGTNAAVQELADRFFFETVVRLHRSGEGEPYTGLKSAAEIDHAVEGADKALQNGDIEAVVKMVTDRVAAGVRERFARVRELQPHADENVAAGRRYVAAYVEFVHFVEEASAHGAAEGEAHQSRGVEKR